MKCSMSPALQYEIDTWLDWGKVWCKQCPGLKFSNQGGPINGRECVVDRGFP